MNANLISDDQVKFHQALVKGLGLFKEKVKAIEQQNAAVVKEDEDDDDDDDDDDSAADRDATPAGGAAGASGKSGGTSKKGSMRRVKGAALETFEGTIRIKDSRKTSRFVNQWIRPATSDGAKVPPPLFLSFFLIRFFFHSFIRFFPSFLSLSSTFPSSPILTDPHSPELPCRPV